MSAISRKSLITSIGSAVVDIMFYTKEGSVIANPRNLLKQKLLAFERSGKITIDSAYFLHGGGAANSALTFARMGLHPQIFTSLGDDVLGTEYRDYLKSNGINTNLVQTSRSHTTGMSTIVSVSDHRDHVIFVYRGATRDLQCTPRTLAPIRTPWVYLTALSGSWRYSLGQIFKHSFRAQAKIVWNPGADQIAHGIRGLHSYLKQTAVLIVNHDEALELAVRSGRHTAARSPQQLARFLHTFGPKQVIVTRGHYGAFLYDGTAVYFQPAKIVRMMNKTGAGDAFGSGFVAGLIRFKSIQKALSFARYNSSSVVSKIGAQTGILTYRDALTLKL